MLTGVLPRYGGPRGGRPRRRSSSPRSVRPRAAPAGSRVLQPARSTRTQEAPRQCGGDAAGWLACFGPAVQDRRLDRRPRSATRSSRPSRPTPPSRCCPLAAAKNALDGSGDRDLRELTEIPRNQVSAIRAPAAAPCVKIPELTLRYSRLRTLEPALAAPFFPAYRGANGRVVEAAALSPEAASALENAGLGRTFAVAAARRERVERLLSQHAGAAAGAARLPRRGERRGDHHAADRRGVRRAVPALPWS